MCSPNPDVGIQGSVSQYSEVVFQEMVASKDGIMTDFSPASSLPSVFHSESWARKKPGMQSTFSV